MMAGISKLLVEKEKSNRAMSEGFRMLEGKADTLVSLFRELEE